MDSAGKLVGSAQGVVDSAGAIRQPAADTAGQIRSSVSEASAGIDASVRVLAQAIEVSAQAVNDTGVRVDELYRAINQ